ncbi:recombinase family protein [Cytobacillus horneckiae]|uniref:recombinase family protein n=1 Tax=Cytobacillus horneckiae TaxID=549687 RepID=UPI0039A21D38
MKAAIYIRVSTEEQAKHGYSIAAQQEKLEAFCISQGWETYKIYIDDGYSAKDLNRPRFNEMLYDIEKEKIDVLLVYRLDRLTRSVLDLYTILKILDQNECNFKSATEVYDTTNAMGRLFITLVAAIAQWERENTAERVRMGMEKKSKLGKWKGGVSPYGYKVKDKELIINPEEIEVVNKIFEMANVFGFYTIARKLTEMGYETRNGNEWHAHTVRDIANNPVYAGYVTFNEKINAKKPPKEQKLYDAIHEPIISKEFFWELQEKLEKRRVSGGKRLTSDYYFSSVLKCGRCGSSMSGHKSGGFKTYRCSGKKSGKTCTSHIIKEDTLVETVFKNYESLIEEIKFETNTTEVSSDKIKQLQLELKQIEKLITKQKIMYEKDIIDIDELINKTEELRLREKELNTELKTINNSLKKSNNGELNYIKENIQSLWMYANDYEKKELMTNIFTQLVIDTEDKYRNGSGIPREIKILSVK